jgi:predicted negative regulator of RcsB-dependent stress response
MASVNYSLVWKVFRGPPWKNRKRNLMAKRKITRKELLKKPDEFLTFSGKAVSFVSAHQSQLRYLGVAILIIAVAYLAVHTYLRYVNKKGQEAYNTAYYSLIENIKPNAVPEDLRKSEDLFTKVMDKYSLSKAARLALPNIAYAKFRDKNYDEAIAHYRTFLDKVSGDTYYDSLTTLALATCYEAKGDLKTAIKTLNSVIGSPDDPFKEAAMLALARLYRLDNRPEKANEILKEFVQEYKDSPFLPMAKAHLR